MRNTSSQYQGKRPRGRRLLWVVPILIVLLGIWWALHLISPDPASLYAAAVEDAVTAEPEELEPLVELTPTDPRTTWDDQGRVLLLSWHRHPERYPAGEDITLAGGEIWVFTDREIAAWYQENQAGVKDWNLRLKQLIGLPPEAGYTHVSGFWTDPVEVVRPAYVTDVTAQMALDFPPDTDPEFREWFADNSTFSYEESAYPWTRLGYTYDWAVGGTEYGLTEFLIEPDATVEVAFTKTTADFLTWLDQGAHLEENS